MNKGLEFRFIHDHQNHIYEPPDIAGDSDYKARLKAAIIAKRLLPCNERPPFTVFSPALIEKHLNKIKVGSNISSLQPQEVTHNFKLSGSSGETLISMQLFTLSRVVEKFKVGKSGAQLKLSVINQFIMLANSLYCLPIYQDIHFVS